MTEWFNVNLPISEQGKYDLCMVALNNYCPCRDFNDDLNYLGKTTINSIPTGQSKNMKTTQGEPHFFRLIVFLLAVTAIATATNAFDSRHSGNLKTFDLQNIPRRKPTPGDDVCPPCFNCMLPLFECKQYSSCNEYNGRCECIPGFGGEDCKEALCGGLSSENNQRPIRNVSEGFCKCEDGWGGINCNLCQSDDVCDNFLPGEVKTGAVCNKNGMIVNKMYQGCDVTNEKIKSILGDKSPQVTFSCNRTSEICDFQFWVDQVESFYCGLDTCKFEYDIAKNTSHYNCDNAKCKCLPGEFLCGKSGSIDISDFLTETIKGPGDFSCNLETRKCIFTEPSMNDLISTIFGDPYIMLQCESGECIHYSEIPGYLSPEKPPISLKQKIILITTSIALVMFICVIAKCILVSPLFTGENKNIEDPKSDGERIEDLEFLSNTMGATLTFENINYFASNQHILKQVSGVIKPGLTAIMGGSGAGKTTLLDILALKNKCGKTKGSIKINGEEVGHTNKKFKKQISKTIGFVDQENFLLPTLTVYETVLNSALLRLPKIMSFEEKQKLVIKVMQDLRIYDIKDRIVGDDFSRGISGGEKRRVSIACELVTSPSILFLDEPTSGLDSNNAKNVIECLERLAVLYNRTIVVSIHQPRSNIFQKFDKLILLGNGEMCYSGTTLDVRDFLKNCGYECPRDYNLADFLIDVTFETPLTETSEDQEENFENSAHDHAHSHALLSPNTDTAIQGEWAHLAEHRDELRSLLASTNKSKYNTIDDASKKNILTSSMLSSKFSESQFYADLNFQIKNANASVSETTSELAKRQVPKASFWQQLVILSSRSFKNIYRNPKLLLGNYMLSLLMGLFLGFLYYGVSNDISGFQNRLGLFFFIITFLGFSSFTGLSSFNLERLIFLKERSNNYYHPLAYYLSKVISDIFPLRVVPPIILVLIIYPLVGLNMGLGSGIAYPFFKCIEILIMFNLAIAFLIQSIGFFFQELSNSIIFSVLVLLWSILFSGLFINTQEITNIFFKYMKNGSIFYYAYESLIINEVKDLMLKEKKYGLNIEIPGATILSTFGFHVQHLTLDISILIAFMVFFFFFGYVILKWRVVENR